MIVNAAYVRIFNKKGKELTKTGYLPRIRQFGSTVLLEQTRIIRTNATTVVVEGRTYHVFEISSTELAPVIKELSELIGLNVRPECGYPADCIRKGCPCIAGRWSDSCEIDDGTISTEKRA